MTTALFMRCVNRRIFKSGRLGSESMLRLNETPVGHFVIELDVNDIEQFET